MVKRIVLKENAEGKGYTISDSGMCTVYENDVVISDEDKYAISEVQFDKDSYVTSIGENAFKNCPKLSVVYFPQNVNMTINRNAFEGCKNLYKLDFDNTRYIDYNLYYGAFSMCGFEELDFSSKLLCISCYDQDVFTGCRNLRTVKIGPHCEIDYYSFGESCSNLSDIVIYDDGEYSDWVEETADEFRSYYGDDAVVVKHV